MQRRGQNFRSNVLDSTTSRVKVWPETRVETAQPRSSGKSRICRKIFAAVSLFLVTQEAKSSVERGDGGRVL